jgi:hypothetical protein
MLLTLGTCNSQPGTNAQEYALRYPGRRRRDVDVLRLLEWSFREAASATHMNAGRLGRL